LAAALGGPGALPVAAEIDRRFATHPQPDNTIDLVAIADAAQVLAPSRLLGITDEIRPGDMVMMPKFAAPQAGDNNYERTEFWHVVEVAEALGLSLTGKAKLDQPSVPDLDAVEGCLKRVGIHPEFIERCLMPITGAAEDRRQGAEVAIARIRAIWNVPLDTMLAANANDPLWFAPVANCRFKRPLSASPASVAAYASYSRYLLTALCDAFPAPHATPLPLTPSAMRSELFGNSAPSFRRALESTWRMGVPVLPISSGGGFHGACFRIHGRAAITLKQTMKSPSRWLFDLAHELGHLAEGPDNDFAEVDVDGRDDDEEARAHRFAAQVLLKDDFEGLFSEVWKRASGRPERLKRVTQKVAEDTHADIGLLAQHVAFRASLEHDTKWWSTAIALEAATESPFQIAKEVMLRHVSMNRVPEPARGMLDQVLTLKDA
jgi:Zn-dependent peptidase ImmA (M78 family)